MERIVVIVFSGTKLASPISTSMFVFLGFFCSSKEDQTKKAFWTWADNEKRKNYLCSFEFKKIFGNYVLLIKIKFWKNEKITYSVNKTDLHDTCID